MTEEEWQTSNDYVAMLRLVHARTTVRQARLCMVAGCRLIAAEFNAPRTLRILEAAEECADNPGAETALESRQMRWHFSEPQIPKSGRWKRLSQAIADAHNWLDECRIDGTWDSCDRYRSAGAALAHAMYMSLRESPLEAFTGGEGDAVYYCAQLIDRTGVLRLRDKPGQSLFEIDEAKEQIRVAIANVLRELFGNPFRPVSFSPSWRTDTAVSLARTMYDAREFSALPILADALQDAGCDNDDILAHCRNINQPHVRGCWVTDLVLGKS